MAISVTWDATFQAAPLGSESIANGDNRIVAFKDAVQERTTREHIWGTSETQANHGLHREGSALAYIDASEPTNQPDGATALSAIDEGRLWGKTGDDSLWYYNGTTWVHVNGTDGTFGGDIIATGNGVFGAKIITSANYLAAAVPTYNEVFDKLNSFIPTNGDIMKLGGVILTSGNSWIPYRAERISSTRITVYTQHVSADSFLDIDFDDGSVSTLTRIGISW